MDTNDRLEKYEQEIEQLKKEIEQLKYTVDRLRYCKAPEPRFFYWNWLVEMRITEEDKFYLELIMMPFSSRYEGEEIPALLQNKVRKIPVENIDFGYLCRNEKPSYSEFAETLAKVMGWTGDAHVRALLKVMYQQGIKKDMCQYLLSEAGEDPNSELYPDET